MDFESLGRFLAVLMEFRRGYSISAVSMRRFLKFIQVLNDQGRVLWSDLFEPEEITDPAIRHQRLTWCLRQLFELSEVSACLRGNSHFCADWQEPLRLWREGYGENHHYLPAGLTLQEFRYIIGGSSVSVNYIPAELYLPIEANEVQFEQLTTRAGVISLEENPFFKDNWFHPADRRTIPLTLTLEEILWVLRYRLTYTREVYPKQVACRNALVGQPDGSDEKVLVLALPERPEIKNPQVARLRFESVERTHYDLTFPFGEFLPAP